MSGEIGAREKDCNAHAIISNIYNICFSHRLQICQVPVRVRIENESVQFGGRTEHGHSWKSTRGPPEQVSDVRLHARASGDHGRRPSASPRPTVVGGARPTSPQSPATTAPSSATAPSATATATALRQRAGRRRSVPSLGRRNHRQ